MNENDILQKLYDFGNSSFIDQLLGNSNVFFFERMSLIHGFYI
jgi:hypothetical protein